MNRHSVSRSVVRSAVGLLGFAACASISDAQGAASGTSVTVAAGSRSRFAADVPVSLGQRRIGTGTRRAAMLSVADSVVRAWGWQIASVDLKRAAMRTEWLYFAGTEMTPRAGRPCEEDNVVGLRLDIALRQPANDSAEFVVRGEARFVRERGRVETERFAHRSFATISAALRDASRAATLWPDVFSREIERVSGEVEVSSGGRVQACVTVRP